MYSGKERLKGGNPLPMPDPGDGPRIDSISHDKRPRAIRGTPKVRPTSDLNVFRRMLALFCLSVCPTVRPHGTTRLAQEGFLLNLLFESFSKICRQNSSYIKVLTRVTGTLHDDQHTFIVSRSVLLRMRKVSDSV